MHLHFFFLLKKDLDSLVFEYFVSNFESEEESILAFYLISFPNWGQINQDVNFDMEFDQADFNLTPNSHLNAK